MEDQLRSDAVQWLARLHIAQADGGGAVVVSGDVDVATARSLADALRHTIDGADGADVSVDLSHVGFIDASGLGSLVEALHAARDRGCHLRLVDPSPRVRRIIDLTDSGELFEITATA